MSNNVSPNSNPNTNIIISVIIGLLTTLLWETIFADLYFYIFTHIQSLGLSLINRMIDNTYKDISNGYLNSSSDLTLAILVGIFSGFVTSLSIFIMKIPNHKQVSEKGTLTRKIVKKWSHIRILILVTFIACIIFFLGTIGIISFKTQTTIKTLNNIEIVSPYIPDKEYKQLKSKFHSMQSRHDYENLLNELNCIAEKNSIILKE